VEKYYIINNLPPNAVTTISKELGISKGTVSNILRGKNKKITSIGLIVVSRAQAMAAINMFNSLITKHGDTPLNPLKIRYES